MAPRNHDEDRLAADQAFEQVIAIAAKPASARTRIEQRILDAATKVTDDDIVTHFIRRVLPDVRMKLARVGAYAVPAPGVENPLMAAYSDIYANKVKINTPLDPKMLDQPLRVNGPTSNLAKAAGDVSAADALRERLAASRALEDVQAKLNTNAVKTASEVDLTPNKM